MSGPHRTAAASAVAAPSPPTLREMTFADHPAVFRLESTFFDDPLPPEPRRGLFEDNPLWPRLRDGWPIGWVLEDRDGAVVGAVNNIPSAYRLGGQELVCGNGHCWAVLEEYRGYASLLMGEYFGQDGPDLLVSAKVGTRAVELWSAYAQRVPVGDWANAAYAITRYPEFARDALVRKRVPAPGLWSRPLSVALRVKDALHARSRALPAAPPAFEYRELDGFDARFDGFWAELCAQHPDRLLGVRDAATLRWHYRIPASAGRLWVVAALRDDRLRAYCVVKQHQRPGGITSMKIVDYQTGEPGTDLLAGLLPLALRRAAAQGCSFLEHHGCGLPKMRTFEAVAAYRTAKPSWSFFYLTEDPGLAERLRDPRVWDPSEYDGDSSYK